MAKYEELIDSSVATPSFSDQIWERIFQCGWANSSRQVHGISECGFLSQFSTPSYPWTRTKMTELERFYFVIGVGSSSNMQVGTWWRARVLQLLLLIKELRSIFLVMSSDNAKDSWRFESLGTNWSLAGWLLYAVGLPRRFCHPGE